MALPRPTTTAIAAGAVLSCGLTALGAPPAAAAPATAYVSEVHYDDAGADAGEFIEVTIPAGTSSEGLSLVLYNGNGGAAYGTLALPVVTAPADAPAAVAVDAPGLQNGDPDGFALVSVTGAGTTVLELLSYEGVLTASGGPAAGTTSTDIGVAEGGTTAEGTSLSRVVAGDALVWRPSGPATRGAVDTGAPAAPPPAADCAAPPTAAVGQVQGTTATTPLAGQVVTVRGRVVADTPGLGGFSLQDGGDGDAATSDGVFVASPAAVALGETVQVTGVAEERFGQTQVTATGVAPCDAPEAQVPPVAAAPLDLPADDAARERLEGMLVAPADVLTVSEVFALTRFGELTLSSGGVLVQPTELERPGPAAEAVAAQNALRRVVLDDASSAALSVTTAPYLTPTTPVRVEDEVTLTEPVVLGYGFGAWRLQPADGTADGVLAPQDTRPAAPGEVGGDIRVGSLNVLNYFLTTDPAVGRGASSPEELERQAAKTVAAIRGLGADVVALQEVEDTDATGLTPGDADTAVADLVRRLNEAEAEASRGRAGWAHSPFPDELLGTGRDVIRNAIVYRTDAAAPVGDSVGLVDEAAFANAREPVAQTFRALRGEGGDTFTVVANHFKSKGGGAGATGDNAEATSGGQGAFNGDRVRQARSLAGFVTRLQTETRDPDVVVLGDLNSYTQEDPVQVLREAGLTDVGSTFDPGEHSYVFSALSGSLDHAMTTPSLTAKVTGARHWAISAKESVAYQYDGDPELYAPDPYRSSDHDPLVLGIDLRPGRR